MYLFEQLIKTGINNVYRSLDNDNITTTFRKLYLLQNDINLESHGLIMSVIKSMLLGRYVTYHDF